MKQEVVKITALNDILGENKYKYFVNEIEGYQGIPKGYSSLSGEYNERFKFYKHPEFPEGVFMREVFHTDSYGGDERVVSIEFVKGKEKTVTVFEPI